LSRSPGSYTLTPSRSRYYLIQSRPKSGSWGGQIGRNIEQRRDQHIFFLFFYNSLAPSMFWTASVRTALRVVASVVQVRALLLLHPLVPQCCILPSCRVSHANFPIVSHLISGSSLESRATVVDHPSAHGTLSVQQSETTDVEQCPETHVAGSPSPGRLYSFFTWGAIYVDKGIALSR
jgi:hypothetical protein